MPAVQKKLQFDFIIKSVLMMKDIESSFIINTDFMFFWQT